MLKCYYISQAVQPLMTQELPLPADTLAQGAGESIIPNIIFHEVVAKYILKVEMF